MFDAAHIAGLVAGGAAPVPGAVRRRGDVHHPQDAPRAARRLHPGQPGARRGDRQGAVPRAAGRSARARHRGQGRRVPGGGAARSSRTTPARSWPTPRRWRRPWPTAGLPAGVGRNRQPPDAGRPAPVDADLTGKQAQETLDRAGITLNRNTIPDDPRSAVRHAAACASARRPSRRRACASRRWTRSPRSSIGP